MHASAPRFDHGELYNLPDWLKSLRYFYKYLSGMVKPTFAVQVL
jgi:hypothetical protein